MDKVLMDKVLMVILLTLSKSTETFRNKHLISYSSKL